MAKMTIEERIIRTKAVIEVAEILSEKIECIKGYELVKDDVELTEWQIERNKTSNMKIQILEEIIENLL